jgi:hypothetical protein
MKLRLVVEHDTETGRARFDELSGSQARALRREAAIFLRFGSREAGDLGFDEDRAGA